MAGGAADERQIRVDPAVLEHQPEPPPRPLPRPHGAREVSSPPIPEELLLDIFRRIPDPTDLVLTSAACVTFRRLIADRSFLRQYRKLHAPPLLGFVNASEGLQPAEPPYPSAPAARAVALAGDFSFSFVPAPAHADRWAVRDIRDGRVLLGTTPGVFYDGVLFTEMAVCDPLHRQYLLLPPIPEDLRASVEDPILHNFCETFLAPYGEAAATTGETSFSVIWMIECTAKLVAFVFSSSTRQWRAISQSWTNLLDGLLSSTWNLLFLHRQYACGCFYWLPNWQHELKLLVLDTRTMEFSIAEPPPEAKNSSYLRITMLESGEGRPRMLVSGPDMSSHNYTIWRQNGGSSSQWQKEKVISLPLISWNMLRCAKGTYFLLDHPGGSSFEGGRFTLDIETLQLKRVCASTVHGHTYSNYLPSFSLPKVSTGFEEEVLEQGMDALQAEGSIDGHQDESTAVDADAGGQADVLRVGDGAD